MFISQNLPQFDESPALFIVNGLAENKEFVIEYQYQTKIN